MSRDADDSELNTGLLLFVAYRAMEQRVMAELAAEGHEMTIAHARVFQRIAPGGSRLTDLAEAAQVTKQTAGFLVDQLEKAGYVRRTPDPTDGRARLVVVAERGTQAVARSAVTVAAVEQEWADHLGARRYAQLRAILTDLREITDPWRERP
jgi:DNA-binding MarR family transcriptional regulator